MSKTGATAFDNVDEIPPNYRNNPKYAHDYWTVQTAPGLIATPDAQEQFIGLMQSLARTYSQTDETPDIKLINRRADDYEKTPRYVPTRNEIWINPDVSDAYGRNLDPAQQLRIIADTLAHEIEHANNPEGARDKQKAAERNPQIPKTAGFMQNIVEDLYIDELRCRRNPGMRAAHAFKIDTLMSNHSRRPRVDNLDDRTAALQETALQAAMAGYAKGEENDDELSDFADIIRRLAKAAKTADNPADRRTLTDRMCAAFRAFAPDDVTGKEFDKSLTDLDTSLTDEKPEYTGIDPADREDMDKLDADDMSDAMDDVSDDMDADASDMLDESDDVSDVSDTDDMDDVTPLMPDMDDMSDTLDDMDGTDESDTLDDMDTDTDASDMLDDMGDMSDPFSDADPFESDDTGADTNDTDDMDGADESDTLDDMDGTGGDDMESGTGSDTGDMSDDTGAGTGTDTDDNWTDDTDLNTDIPDSEDIPAPDPTDRESGKWHNAGSADEYQEPADRWTDRADDIRAGGDALDAHRATRNERLANGGNSGRMEFNSDHIRSYLSNSGLAEDIRRVFEKFKQRDISRAARSGPEIHAENAAKAIEGIPTDRIYESENDPVTTDRTISVALDTSRSMWDKDGTDTTRLFDGKVATAAAAIAADAMDDIFLASSFSGSDIGLITGPNERFEYQHLDTVGYSSNTPLAGGLLRAYRRAEKHTNTDETVVFAICDGEPTAKFNHGADGQTPDMDAVPYYADSVGDNATYPDADYATAAKAVQRIRADGGIVIGIGIGDADADMLDAIFGSDSDGRKWIHTESDELDTALLDAYRSQL